MVIVGLSNPAGRTRELILIADDGGLIVKDAGNINAYLIEGPNVIVRPVSKSLAKLPEMARGNLPTDGGHLMLEHSDIGGLGLTDSDHAECIRPFVGSKELISGRRRFCIWIVDDVVDRALKVPQIEERVVRIRTFRSRNPKAATAKAADWPHRFDDRKPISKHSVICVPVISFENRPYLPAALLLGGRLYR